MALPATKEQSEYGFWKDIRDKYGDYNLLDTYKKAFPDESLFYDDITKQYGEKNAANILIESLLSPQETGMGDYLQQSEQRPIEASPIIQQPTNVGMGDVQYANSQIEMPPEQPTTSLPKLEEARELGLSLPPKRNLRAEESIRMKLRAKGYPEEQIENLVRSVQMGNVPLMLQGVDMAEPVFNDLTTAIPEYVPPIKQVIKDTPSGAKVLAHSLMYAPQETAANLLTVTQGYRGATVVDKGWVDNLIEKLQKNPNKFAREVAQKYQNRQMFVGPFRMKLSDVATFSQQLGYSGVSMGVGAGAGLLGSLATPAVGTGAAMGASAAVAFQMSSYQIMQSYLEMQDEIQRGMTGKGLTKVEENRLKKEFAGKAIKYGLWEAIPEAMVSGAWTNRFMKALTRTTGSQTAARGIMSRMGSGMVSFGEMALQEAGQETITQMGQNATLAGTELSDVNEVDWTNADDWMDAFYQVAPQTLLLTAAIGGIGAGIAAGGRSASTRIAKSRVSQAKQMAVEELGENDPYLEKVNDIIDNVAKQDPQTIKGIIDVASVRPEMIDANAVLPALQANERVGMRPTGTRGTIIDIQDNKASIQLDNGMKATVPLNMIYRTSRPPLAGQGQVANVSTGQQPIPQGFQTKMTQMSDILTVEETGIPDSALPPVEQEMMPMSEVPVTEEPPAQPIQVPEEMQEQTLEEMYPVGQLVEITHPKTEMFGAEADTHEAATVTGYGTSAMGEVVKVRTTENAIDRQFPREMLDRIRPINDPSEVRPTILPNGTQVLADGTIIRPEEMQAEPVAPEQPVEEAAPIKTADVAPVLDAIPLDSIEDAMTQRADLGDEFVAKQLAETSVMANAAKKKIKQFGATAFLDEVQRSIDNKKTGFNPNQELDDWRQRQADRLKDKYKDEPTIAEEITKGEEGYLRLFAKKEKLPTTEDPEVTRILDVGMGRISRLQGYKNSMNYLKTRFADFILATFEPDLKRAGYNQFADDLRTGLLPIIPHAKFKVQHDFDLIWGDKALTPDLTGMERLARSRTAKDRRKLLLKIIALSDLSGALAEGLTLPQNVQDVIAPIGLPAIDVELNRLTQGAPQPVLDALDAYKDYAQTVGRNLVARGELLPSSLKDFYMPHRMLEYRPQWVDFGPFAFKKAQEPFAYYEMPRKGSVKDLVISEDMFITHFAQVEANNAFTDWAIGVDGVLPKNDIVPNLTPQQLKTLFGNRMKPAKGRRYKIGDEDYVGYAWEYGPQYYTRMTGNLANLFKAVDLIQNVDQQELLRIMNLPTESERFDAFVQYASDIGPRGGAALRVARIMSPYMKVYVIPKDIATKLGELKVKQENVPILSIVNALNRKWKGMATGLLIGGIPFQLGNMIGDAANLRGVNKVALLYFGDALKITNNFRPENRHNLNPWQQYVLKVAEDKAVFDSGLLYELQALGVRGRGFLDAGKYWRGFSSKRESLLRLAMLDRQLRRIREGKRPYAPEFENDIKDLDDISAAAFIAREFGGDYGALPPWWKKYITGMAFPFATWFERTPQNWVKYIKNAPFQAGTEIAMASVLPWLWNNGYIPGAPDDIDEIEGMLPEYVKEGWHFIPPWGIERDENGKATAVHVMSPQLPHNIAASFIGMNRLGYLVTEVKNKRMNAKEAAGDFLGGVVMGPPKYIGRLANPVAQIILSLAMNKDTFTGKPIVPKELEGMPEHLKMAKYWTPYTIEHLVLPYGRMLRNLGEEDRKLLFFVDPETGKEATLRYLNDLATGRKEASWFARGLGYRRIDLKSAEDRRTRERVWDAREQYSRTVYDLTLAYKSSDSIKDFMNSPDLTRILQEGAKRNVYLSGDEIRGILTSPWVHIDVLSKEIRITHDKEKLDKLEKERAMWYKIATARGIQSLPTGARPALAGKATKQEGTIKRSDEEVVPIDESEKEGFMDFYVNPDESR